MYTFTSPLLLHFLILITGIYHTQQLLFGLLNLNLLDGEEHLSVEEFLDDMDDNDSGEGAHGDQDLLQGDNEIHETSGNHDPAPLRPLPPLCPPTVGSPPRLQPPPVGF